ncbi:hypothetical protein HK405_010161 [Cladochytrium tenue]|nr:hypothetical protein HK405_010161 [Cladochytrium tenue]
MYKLPPPPFSTSSSQAPSPREGGPPAVAVPAAITAAGAMLRGNRYDDPVGAAAVAVTTNYADAADGSIPLDVASGDENAGGDGDAKKLTEGEDDEGGASDDEPSTKRRKGSKKSAVGKKSSRKSEKKRSSKRKSKRSRSDTDSDEYSESESEDEDEDDDEDDDEDGSEESSDDAERQRRKRRSRKSRKSRSSKKSSKRNKRKRGRRDRDSDSESDEDEYDSGDEDSESASDSADRRHRKKDARKASASRRAPKPDAVDEKRNKSARAAVAPAAVAAAPDYDPPRKRRHEHESLDRGAPSASRDYGRRMERAEYPREDMPPYRGEEVSYVPRPQFHERRSYENREYDRPYDRPPAGRAYDAQPDYQTSAQRGGRSRSRSPRRRSPSPGYDRRREFDNRPSNPPKNVIGIFNLPQDVSKDDLRGIFEQYGEVQSTVVLVDKHTGNSRGFGFVSYATIEEATNAKNQMDNTLVRGRRVRVDYSKTGGPHAPTPGRYLGRPRPTGDSREHQGEEGRRYRDYEEGGGGRSYNDRNAHDDYRREIPDDRY